MTNPQFTRLWCLSICHNLLRPTTEYAHLEITTAQQIVELSRSTQPPLSLIRSRWTLIRPKERRGPDNSKDPTIVPWSLIRRWTRLSSCSSKITENPCDLIQPKLYNATSQRPPWNMEHLSFFCLGETRWSKVEKHFFRYRIPRQSHVARSQDFWCVNWIYRKMTVNLGHGSPLGQDYGD